MTRVAINGFGRIGRAVFRIIAERPDSGIEVVAINDLADDDVLAYLLKYDTVMGNFEHEVEVGEARCTAGHTVRMLMERDITALPWGELGVDVVIESTGVFRDTASLQKHLDAGAKRVILTVPPRTRWRRSCWRQRRPARQLGPHRFQCLVHHQLPGTGGQGAPRAVHRDQTGHDDDRPRLHQ